MRTKLLTALRRAGGPALIPVIGALVCLGLIPFAAGARAAQSAPVAAAAPAPAPFVSPEPTPQSQCVDDGTTGKRVMALYVRGDEQTDRFGAYEARFRGWLDTIDGAFVFSAKLNGGGWRKVRYVRDADCRQVIDDVVVPQASMESTDTITVALKSMGYDRADRKYIVWYDQDACGVGFGAGGNDQPQWFNLSNYGPHYAAIGTGCWGWAPTLHELLHTLGAVNSSAPHATDAGHCYDDEDVLCYDDGDLPAGGLQQICRLPAGQPKNGYAANIIDCNGDDYFNTDPAPGSYLDTHWNVADSDFLYAQRPANDTTPAVTGASTQKVKKAPARTAKKQKKKKNTKARKKND
ncbi:hypothetical protein [Kineosporia sp. NBRC 101731]|uniref:hypothetical protein n=1 Tax=Kineosporia sp. NBRC 101731 TaxID=3032199 RepID=UPI0024A02A06|nr:hypothetical protein [Kineosporia sp. NBRC 101731]GLY31386.1 hypothetical protein Kisp02_47510 [Kineosporia sp. NBRC 101731]